MIELDLHLLGLCLSMLVLCTLLGCSPGSGPAPEFSPTPHWQVARFSEDRGAGSAAWYFDMEFVGPRLGWLTDGSGKLLHTQDGGTTWTTQDAEGLWVDFVDGKVGWIAHFVPGQDRSMIGRTADGGSSWTWSQIPGREVRVVAAVSAQEAWVAALPGPTGRGGVADPVNVVFRTRDGGESWQSINHPALHLPGFEVSAMHFLDSHHGWIAGCNPPALLSTQDGGKTFDRSALPASSRVYRADCFRFSFPTAQEGWLSIGESFLLHTRDAGRSWEKVTPKAKEQDISTVVGCSFPTSLEGWIIDSSPAAFRTRDGGNTWSRVETGAEGIAECAFNRIIFTDEEHGWILGEGGEYPNDMLLREGDRISFVLRYVP